MLAEDFGRLTSAGGTLAFPSPQAVDLVHEALAHAYHAGTVIANMLDYTKLRAGRLKIKSERFDLRQLLESSLVLVRHSARKKDVALMMEIDAEHSPRAERIELLGPHAHIQQVILNLLTNAVKYTQRGQVTLRATLRDETLQKPPAPSPRALAMLEDAVELDSNQRIAIQFAVQDTGCGVSTDRASSIFEVFEQGFEPGTGLGLPLCNELLTHMGSSGLELSSLPSGGSVFSFSLTLAIAPPLAPPASVAASPAPTDVVTPAPATERSLRVLVADDQKLNRLILIKQLKAVLKNATFEEAETGEAALEMLRSSSSWDIAFLDQNYSKGGSLTGTDVTQAYREHERRGAATAVVQAVFRVSEYYIPAGSISYFSVCLA